MSKIIKNRKFEKRFPEFDSEFWKDEDLSSLRRFAYSVNCNGSAQFLTEGTPRYVESDLEPDSRPKWLQFIWPFRSSKKHKPWDYKLHSSPAYVPIVTQWQHWMVSKALEECSDWNDLFHHEYFLSALKYVDEEGDSHCLTWLYSKGTRFAPWLYGGDLINAGRYEICESMWRDWDVEEWVGDCISDISDDIDIEDRSIAKVTDLKLQAEWIEENFPDKGKAPIRGKERHVLEVFNWEYTSNSKYIEDRFVEFEPDVGSVFTMAGECSGVTHLRNVEIEPGSIKLADLDMTFTEFQKMYNEIE